MAITPERVREIFKGLENGDGAAFFKQVADDVDWTVMGTHPHAGHYLRKADFIAAMVAELFEENSVDMSGSNTRGPGPLRM